MRHTLAQPDCLVAASVYDPMSARIAADLGFELGIMAGSVAAMTIAGAPDLALVSMGELAEQVRRTCRASRLPVLIDADHGFGNALHVMRTVEELEAAGAAAVSIEDTRLPGVHGDSTAALISPDEMRGKLRAALAARQSSNLSLIARTSCVPIAGLEEALRRAPLYDSLGVDAHMFVGLKTAAELETLADCTTLPIILGGCAEEVLAAARGGDFRVAMLVLGIHPYLATLKGAQTAYASLRQNQLPDPALLASADLVRQLTRAADYRDWQADFLAHENAEVTWDWATQKPATPDSNQCPNQ
ncbi:MAG: isocitrate lyase/PEP mutase family protein [Cellvibrionales bacterium]|nr:isocitrate lyase/PEP mutase family protein [Cellvibrionales bacterium]